jgi:hypothetical protein
MLCNYKIAKTSTGITTTYVSPLAHHMVPGSAAWSGHENIDFCDALALAPLTVFLKKSVKITKGAVGSTHLAHLNYSSGRSCCLFLLAFPSPVISQFLSKSLKTFCVAQLCSWIVSPYKVSTYNPTNRLHPENRQTGPNKAAYMQTTKCNFPVR